MVVTKESENQMRYEPAWERFVFAVVNAYPNTDKSRREYQRASDEYYQEKFPLAFGRK